MLSAAVMVDQHGSHLNQKALSKESLVLVAAQQLIIAQLIM